MILRTTFFVLCCLFISPLYAKPVIMVFGDSLSAGYGLPTGQGWVNLLQQRLNNGDYGYEVINASISGDTTSGGAARIDQALSKHRPVLVIVELGGNDGLRGLSIKAMQNNLSKIVQSVKASSAKVLLVGMQIPPNYGLSFARRFENSFKTIAEEENIPLVPFLLKGIESDMSYYQRDRIHPNVKGQQVMLDNVWPHLKDML